MKAEIHYYTIAGIFYNKEQVVYKSVCEQLETEPMNRDLISIYILEKKGLSSDTKKITCSDCKEYLKVLFQNN